jgi:hypothetical protein
VRSDCSYGCTPCDPASTQLQYATTNNVFSATSYTCDDPTPSPDSSGSVFSIGAIVGIVTGGIVLLIGVVALIVRRRMIVAQPEDTYSALGK